MKKPFFASNHYLRALALSTLFFCCRVDAQERLYANEFPLSDVQLSAGPFKHARDLNIQTLLQYNVDRLPKRSWHAT
jgi:uncharacterized protein